MTLKTSRFIDANKRSPVVYGGVVGKGIVYRLEDGTSWALTRKEAKAIGHPRWAHLERTS